MKTLDKIKQAIQGMNVKFSGAVQKAKQIATTINTPIDRSNQSTFNRTIGSMGEKGVFGPLPQVVTAMTKVAPKTILPTSHFFAGLDPTGLSENIGTEGRMLPERQKYTPYRIAGGATGGLITGGPKMLLKQTGIGAGLGALFTGAKNLYEGKPITTDLGKGATEGAGYAAQSSSTFNLTNGIVNALGSKIAFLRPLTEGAINQGLPTSKMTLGVALGKLGRTGLKRIIKAALIETPIEGMIYGVKEREEKQKLLDSIENQMVQNLIFNVGFAGVNTIWDSRVIAPIVAKSINQTMDSVNKQYPQLMAENLSVGMRVKPVGGQEAINKAEENKIPEDLQFLADKASSMSKSEFNKLFREELNNQNLTKRQTATNVLKIMTDKGFTVDSFYNRANVKKGEANLGGGKVVPTVKVGEYNIEEPVAKAVSATFDEGTASSGFHRNLDKVSNTTPSWAIVYNKAVSPELISSAEKAGLKVNIRPNGITDVYLPNVLRGDSKNAQKIFDKFAENYQSTKVEHSTFFDVNQTLYRGEGGQNKFTGTAGFVSGKNFATDAERAGTFGEVKAFNLKPNAKVLQIDAVGKSLETLAKELNVGKDDVLYPDRLRKIMIERGYDAVVTRERLAINGKITPESKINIDLMLLNDNAIVPVKSLDIESEKARLLTENRSILNEKPVGETVNSYLSRNPEKAKLMTQNRQALAELGMRQRGFFRQIQNDPNTIPEIKNAVAELPQFYQQKAQRPVWDDAVRQVAENPDRVRERLVNTNERSSDERSALWQALAQKYFREGNIADGVEMIRMGAEEATMTGRASAAWAMWSRMTPEGMIKWAEKQFDTAGEKQSFAGKFVQSIANKVGIKTKATGRQAREISYDVSREMNRINKEATNQIAKEAEQGRFDFFNKVFDVGVASTKRIVTAAGSLSRRLQGAIESKDPKNEPIKDMINTLFASAKELLPKDTKLPRSPFEFITLGLKNKNQYQSVFELAQKRILDKYKNRPEELAILKPFIDKIFVEPFSKTQGEKAMGIKMKELGIDVGKLIKEHYSVVETTKQDLLLKLQLETGLSKEELKPLTDFVEKRFAELTQAKKQAYLEKIFAEKKVKVKEDTTAKNSLTQKLIELSNTGAFSDQKYNDLLAEKLGLPTMTPELAQKIYQKMSALQVETDPYKRRMIITDVFDDINKASPPGLSEIIDVMRYNGMLSGFKPQLRNIYGNFFNLAVLRPTVKVVEVFNDWVGSTLRGAERKRYAKEVPAYYKAFINSFPDAITALSQGWKGIARSEDPELRSLRTRQFSPKITFGSRALEAMDRFFTVLGTQAEFASLQARGLSEEEAKLQAQNTAEQFIYRNKLDPKNLTGQGAFLSGYDQLLGGVEKFTHDFPAIKWVIPFIRIGGMVMKESLQYAPVTSSLTKLDASGEKLSQQAAKSFVGYAVMLAGMKLAMEGKTTWAVPTDEEKRKLFYDSGRIPYAVKVGGRWVPMQYFGPLIFALGVPAAFSYYNSEDPKGFTKEGVDKLSYVLMNTMKGQMRLFSAQSFLSSFENLLKIVSGDEDTDLAKFAVGVVSPALNPYQGLMRSIAQAIDPVFRKAKTPMETILKDIPFLSTTVPAYTNTLGEPSKRQPENLVSPYDMGKPNAEFEVPYQIRISELQNNAVKRDVEEKAKQFLMDMKGAKVEEAQKQLDDMKANNPLLYEEVKKQFNKQKKSQTTGNTTTDLYRTQPGQEPGRARYIVNQLKEMSNEEAVTFLNDMHAKGVITPKVQTEIKKLMMVPKATETYGVGIFEKIKDALSVPEVGAADVSMGQGVKPSATASVQGAGVGYPTTPSADTKSLVFQFNPDTKKFEDSYGNEGPIQDSGKTTPYIYTFVKKGEDWVDEFGKTASFQEMYKSTAIKNGGMKTGISGGSTSKVKVTKKLLAAAGKVPKQKKLKLAKLPKLKSMKTRVIKSNKIKTITPSVRIPRIKKIKVRFSKPTAGRLKV